MFSNRSRGDRPVAPPASIPAAGGGSQKRGMFSVIGADITITGNIKASAELHIEGRIDGDVDCSSLAQGADSHIFGSVSAESARLAGTVEGAVRVRQLIVERSARIVGDVEYEAITIENGGHIDGRLKRMSAVAETSAAAEAAAAGSAYDPTPVAPAGDLLSAGLGKVAVQPDTDRAA